MNSQYENQNIVKKNFLSGDDGDNTAKGVQMGKRPYLWRENNPVDPYVDTPCENFVPTPTMHSGEDSKAKKIIKYVAIGIFVAFMVYALISIILEDPAIFKFGETSVSQYF